MNGTRTVSYSGVGTAALASAEANNACTSHTGTTCRVTYFQLSMMHTAFDPAPNLSPFASDVSSHLQKQPQK